MSNKRKEPPPAKRSGAGSDRQARLAAALKANLARRKAQARRRAPATTEPQDRG